MSQSARKYLTAQVSDDKLEEVLKYLLDEETKISEEISSSALIQSGRLNRLNKQINEGIISVENAKLERNQIRKTLIDLTYDLPSELTLTTAKEVFVKKRNLGWLVGGLIYLLIGSLFLILAFSPKKNLRIEAILEVEQLTFTHLGGYYQLSGKTLKTARLGNIEWLELEGDSIAVDTLKNGEFKPPKALNQAILLKPFQEVPDQAISMSGNLTLEDLPIKPNATITLFNSDYEEKNNNLRITIQQEASIEGRLEYKGWADFLPEYYSAEGIEGVEEFDEETHVLLIGPTDSKRSIKVQVLKRFAILESDLSGGH